MNRIKLLIAFLALILCTPAFSTEITKEYENQFKRAMLHIQNENYNEAMPLLLAMRSVNNSNSNIAFHLGFCTFHLQFDKTLALAYFDEAAKNLATKYINTAKTEKAPNQAVYFQGLCYQYLGQNDKAIAKYEEYLENTKTMNSDKLVVSDAKRKLQIAKEIPDLFTPMENRLIVSRRKNAQSTVTAEFKSKLSKVMEIINDDNIEAMLLLKEMLKDYPSEPNINYLMGTCMLNIKPYNDLAADYFQVADKNAASFTASATGLDYPLFVKYFLGVALQMKGDHKEALANFEVFDKNYPADYVGFKPEFIKRMEYSRSMIHAIDSMALASQNTVIPVVDTATPPVGIPALGTPIAVDNSTTTNETPATGEYTTYYSVQVGAGNMKERYFRKVTELRIARYPNGMKRFVTGKYAKKSEAKARQKELVRLGYKDAYVLKMRGRK